MKHLYCSLITIVLFSLVVGTMTAQDLDSRYTLVKEMRAKATWRAPGGRVAKSFTLTQTAKAVPIRKAEIPYDLVFFTSKGTLLIASERLFTRLEWGADVEDLAQVMDEYVDVVREENGVLYAQGVGGIFRSSDDGKTWQQVLDEFTVGLSSSSTTLAAGGFGGEVWVSVDKGNTWKLANAADTANAVFSYELAVVGNTVAYKAFTDPFRVSPDQGKTWQKSGVEGAFLWSNTGHMYTDKLNLSGKVSRSSNGTGWTEYANHNLFMVQKFYEDERVRIVSSYDELEYQQPGGPWYSFTNAVGGETVNSFAIDPDGYLWVGTQEGSLWASLDPIVSLASTKVPAAVSLTAPANNSTATSGKVLFAWGQDELADRYRIQVSLSSGFEAPTIEDEVSTTAYSTVLPYNNTYFWRVRGENEFGAGEWSDTARFFVPVGTSTESELPLMLALHPAYPNPFNPSATIPFEIHSAGQVTIRAYDMLGREVATLADQVYPAGKHVTNWSATTLLSGVYLIRMQAGGQVFTSTVTLMK